MLVDVDMTVQGNIACRSIQLPASAVTNAAVSAGADIDYSKLEQLPTPIYQQSRPARKYRAKSVWFNLDNGAATTIDDVITVPSEAITVTSAKAVYVDATTGTVAAATFQLGTTLGGAEIVAATNENTKAVGTSTAGSIVSGAVAAAGKVFVRHTGIAATAAGQAFIEIEYTLDAETNNEVFDATVPAHIAFGATGRTVSIEVMLQGGIPSSSRAHTIDLQYGTPSAGYASVLAGATPITLNSSTVVRTAVAGDITTTAFVDGGSFRWVIASSGSGNNGRGLLISTRLSEEAAA